MQSSSDQNPILEYAALEVAVQEEASSKSYEEKRLQKLQKIETKKQAKKEKKKLKKKEKTQKVKNEKNAQKDTLRTKLTEEEYSQEEEKWKQTFQNILHDKIHKKHQKAEKLKAVVEAGVKDNIGVVINCSFDDHMSPSELSSLSHQILYAYSFNSKLEKPAYLCFSSLTGRLKEKLEKIGGFNTWAVVKTEEHLADFYKQECSENRVICLSPDAEEELASIEKGYLYVINGIVDKHRQKNLSHEQARELKLPTRRLPISKHINLNSDAVLTINQVFAILVLMRDSSDWKQVLETVIPPRKINKEADSSSNSTPAEVSSNGTTTSAT